MNFLLKNPCPKVNDLVLYKLGTKVNMKKQTLGILALLIGYVLAAVEVHLLKNRCANNKSLTKHEK